MLKLLTLLDVWLYPLRCNKFTAGLHKSLDRFTAWYENRHNIVIDVGCTTGVGVAGLPKGWTYEVHYPKPD